MLKPSSNTSSRPELRRPMTRRPGFFDRRGTASSLAAMRAKDVPMRDRGDLSGHAVLEGLWAPPGVSRHTGGRKI